MAMAMQIYTTDKTSPRGFSWIWFIRLFQIVITLVVLAITAANVTSFHDIGCSAPSKLSFNLAVVRFPPEFPSLVRLTMSSPSSPWSGYSTSSSPPAPAKSLESSPGSSWVKSPSTRFSSYSGWQPPRRRRTIAPICAIRAASRMMRSGSTASFARALFYTSEIPLLHRGVLRGRLSRDARAIRSIMGGLRLGPRLGLMLS